MIVIGLTGYARAGKDTVADYLVRQYGFDKRRFADPIKDMLRRLDPIVGATSADGQVRVEDLYRRYGNDEAIKASPYGEEMRGLWQRLGTDCVRTVDELFWVRVTIASLGNPDGRYVFADCRFPDEAAAVTGLGGQLWNIRRAAVGVPSAHISEAHAGRLGENLTLENGGTFADLFALVDAAVRPLLGGSGG
jgi:hypothetical protein